MPRIIANLQPQLLKGTYDRASPFALLAARSWFINKELDPYKCRADLAFPELPKGDKKMQRLLDQHALVGKAFGVEIVEIKGFE